MRRLLLLVLLTVIISTNFVFANVYDLSQINNCKMVTEYSAETSLDNMDTVTFGSYYQSSFTSKEPIEWLVLDRQGDNYLLFSKYILDGKRYNDVRNDSNWASCSLRDWLNSTFLDNAFSSDEQNKILTTKVKNANNSNGIYYTNDNLFCLSLEEVNKYFTKSSKTGERIRVDIKGTKFSNQKENGGNPNVMGIAGFMYFSLRSPGQGDNLINTIHLGGSIGDHMSVYSLSGIRPALWVTLSSFNTKTNDITSGLFANIFGVNSNENSATKSKVIVTSDEVDGVYYIDDKDNTRIEVYFNNSGSKKIKDGTKRNLNKYVYIVCGGYDPLPVYVESIVDDDVATVYIPENYRSAWTKDAAESVHNKQVEALIAEIDNYTLGYDIGMIMTKNKVGKSKVKNGWDGDSYYRNNSVAKNEWLQYDNDWYFVGSDGAIVKNQWVQGKYVGSDGKMYAGKQTPDGKYVGMDGNVVNVSNDLKKSIEKEAANPDSWYKTQSGLWYYFENDRTTFKKGWFLDARDKQYYYLDPVTGIMQVGWKNIDGKDYYFNESHDNVPNWYETGNGFFESYGKKVKAYGSMYASEKTPDGYWVNYNGEYIKNGNFILAMNPKKLITIIVGIIVLFMGYNVTRKRLKNRNNEENNT